MAFLGVFEGKGHLYVIKTVFARIHAHAYIIIIRNWRARTQKKMQKNAKKMQKNLRMSKKSSTFAPAFEKKMAG